MRRRDAARIGKLLKVEVVQIGIPVLAEAIAVILLIAAGMVWMIIASTQVPA